MEDLPKISKDIVNAYKEHINKIAEELLLDAPHSAKDGLMQYNYYGRI